MILNKLAGCGLVLCLTLAWNSGCFAEDVAFSDLFTSGALGNDVVVQVGPDQTLVMTEGTYSLQERNLFLAAPDARVAGHVVIESFPEASTPSPKDKTPEGDPSFGPDKKGLRGATGATGYSGKDGGTWVVDVTRLVLEPGASLSFVARGQKGGQGQRGGIGGTGGTGEPGRDAANDLCSRPCPEQGKQGYQGGPPGAGGIGGKGGSGAEVFLSTGLFDLLSEAGSGLEVSAPGGAPGDPGDPGARGQGGPPGPRGSGSTTCICRNPPGPGPTGEDGPESPDATPPGEVGADGSVRKL